MTIEKLRTPSSLLAKVDLPEPEPIFPWNYPTFKDLYQVQDKIRDLKLSPIKKPEDQAYYKTFSREVLADEVLEMMGDHDFLFMPNKFPYCLPWDTNQFILWIKDTVSEKAINLKLEKLVELCGDSILFERSRVTTTPLSRGTIKKVRHIHLWCSKSIS